MFKAVGSIALVAVAVPALALAGRMGLVASIKNPDITVLVKQATTLVHKNATYKKAVLLEADGTPSKAKVTTAAGITQWRIVFNNQTTPGSKYRSVFVNYLNGHWGRIVGNKSPFVEDRNMATPKMTLKTAVAKLRAAGHKDPFANVTLRYPLGPGFSEPLYIFGFGPQTQFWSVGTKTGKVKPIS